MVNNLILSFVIIALSIISSVQMGLPLPNKDELLAAKIKEAIAKKIPIDKVEDFVGRKASLNTNRKKDKDIYSHVSIDIDAKTSGITSLKNIKNVVYWVRPIESVTPMVIGIAWTAKGEMKLFLGEGLPP